MGLLALGTPLEWPEAKKAASQVREWGIEQLLAIWNQAKGKENDSLLWGDEIEYLVVNFDDAERKVKLSLRQADILRALAEDEKLQSKVAACLISTTVSSIQASAPQSARPHSIPNSGASCLRRRRGSLGASS